MKKVIKGLMLSPLLFVIIFQSLSQADVTLTIEDGFGLPGSYNNPVTVNLTNQFDRIRGIQADICDADDYLTCTGCKTTDHTAGFTCTFSELINGCVRVVLMDLSGVNFIEPSNDPIFTLKYDILTDASSGQCDNLTLEGVKVSDESGDPLPSEDVTLVSGQFCFLPPDTDNDSIPDNEDNCPTTPNGPDNGTCTTGDNVEDNCMDNDTCGTGGYCSINQEDSDNDTVGDVCDNCWKVPNPDQLDSDAGQCKHTLTVNLLGGEDVNFVNAFDGGAGPVQLGDGDNLTYYSDTDVELTAVPYNSSWVFTNWRGDLTGSINPDTITIDAVKTVTATFIEVVVGSGGSGVTVTELDSLDPSELPDNATKNMPDYLPYGLINMEIEVDKDNGTAEIKVQLPEPAPTGAKWYKCTETNGCFDFSRVVISGGLGDGAVFNDSRTVVTLYITDNGNYDDNDVLKVIKDPSGLGFDCVNYTDCIDSLYCNGRETCEDGICLAGSPPCVAGYTCDETNDKCTANPTPTTVPPDTGGGGGGGGGGASAATTTTTVPALLPTTTTTTTTTVPEDVIGDTSTTTSIEEPAPEETTTTTTTNERRCPFRRALGDDRQSELDLIRTFRDSRLANSPEGLYLVYLFYAHSEEITDILSSNPDLQAGIREFTLEMIREIKLGLETGGEVILNRTRYLKAVKLLKLIQRDSSSGLRKSISFILEKLGSGDLFKELRIKMEN